jgi:osmotically-inducible protein OsmY
MKNKLILVLGLSSLLMFGACKGSQTNTNTNTNAVVVATPTPVAKTTETAATDPNLKSKIETALKGKGFTAVTVDVTTTPATLRGTVAKGKMAEAVQVAQEANGGKPVKNEVQEK